MTDSPWLTLPQAADRAKRCIRTLTRALVDESLTGYQPGPRGRWRIHVDDLDAWVRGEKAPVKVPVLNRRRAS